MGTCLRDGSNQALFFSVAVFASFGLKIKCPVFSFNHAFYFHIFKIKIA